MIKFKIFCTNSLVILSGFRIKHYSVSTTTAHFWEPAKMAAKMAAEHTLYHLSPRGFWKKFRTTDTLPVTVNVTLTATPNQQGTSLS